MFGENSGTKVIEHNLLPKNKLNEKKKELAHLHNVCYARRRTWCAIVLQNEFGGGKLNEKNLFKRRRQTF